MKIVITLLLGCLLSSISYAQEEWNLQKCVDYALENNIQIKRQRLNTKYSENELKQAKDDKLPTLNAYVENDFSFGRSLTYDNTYDNINSSTLSGTLSASWTLFNGKVLNNTVKQTEIDLEAELQDLEKTKDDITLNIVAGYLEILFAEENQLVTEANIDASKEQIKRTKELVDAGSAAKGDLLEIESQLAQEELTLAKNKNSVQLAYLTLYQLLEVPATQSFKIQKPTLPDLKANLTMMHALDVYNTAVNSRPEIKAAQLRVKSAEKQLEIAKGYLYPSLSLGATYYNLYNNQYTDYNEAKIKFGDQLNNNGQSSIGLTLTIPIFNNFDVKNSISNSQLQIDDYKYQLQQANNQLREDIETAYTNAIAALNRYIAAEKAVTSTKEAFRYAEEKFSLGTINSVEYNDSKTDLTDAQSELIQSKYEYIFRTKILDFYNGIPITL
jgi:outer membrane protein